MPRRPRVPEPIGSMPSFGQGWPMALSLTVSHSTLARGCSPDEEAEPFAAARRWSETARLSILGQLAAHESLLRWLSVGTTPFREEEWKVCRGRHSNPRLIRTAFGSESSVGGEALEGASEVLGLSTLESLRSGWVKPDHVYAEIETTLRRTHRCRWLRRAAVGLDAWPGHTTLGRMLEEDGLRLSVAGPISDGHIVALQTAVREVVRIVHLGGASASPLQPGSACRALGREATARMREAEAAERIERAFQGERIVFIVTELERFDDRSRTLTRFLATGNHQWSWLVAGEPPAMLSGAGPFERAAGRRVFVVSPRLSWRKTFERVASKIGEAELDRWLDDFTGSEELARFLTTGSPPGSEAEGLDEPVRSYLAALALAGPRVSIQAAARFLEPLGWARPPEELLVPGIARLEGEAIVFADDSALRSLRRLVPEPSRAALCRLAAERLAVEASARWTLLLQAGEEEAAERLLAQLDRIDEETAESIIEVIDDLRPSTRNGSARMLHVELLLRAGRYARAASQAARLPDPACSIALARIARRQGRYAEAIALLEKVPADGRTSATELLAAELARLEGDDVAARSHLAEAARLGGADPAASGFEGALIAIDNGDAPTVEDLAAVAGSAYLEARLDTYLALKEGRWSEASGACERAIQAASSLPERIDAGLDRMYLRFVEGDWEEAKIEAREMLAMVEETEGDRAAVGVLFTMAYLSADSGDWARAEEMVRRLQTIYERTADSRRLRETHLLAAHLAFSRGDFPSARAAVANLELDALHVDEREAALLILDEIDSIERIDGPMRSGGTAVCVELRDRHAILAARNHAGSPVPSGTFNRAMAAWEADLMKGVSTQPPVAARGSENLKLIRSLRYLESKLGAPLFENYGMELANRLGVRFDAPAPTSKDSPFELTVLQLAATLPFPFAPEDFGAVRWLFARRNRLGVWNQLGPLAPASEDELDEMARRPGDDWLACGDEAVLRFEGSSEWSSSSRASLAALFLLRSENHALKRAAQQTEFIAERPNLESEGVIGESAGMREILVLAARVARRDVPVCIEGESGTGKELVARSLHRGSSRKRGPFVAINCAALPESLIESELFGHARGAFTGADRDKPGVIEAAHKGTLFLDEVGELPLAAQAKLLRFLQEGEIRRLGESAVRTADVRIVAATNRQLEKEVDEGRFREDLYYRIRGVELLVPPLRERGGDVLLLADHFLARENRREPGGASCFSDDALQALQLYDWPGNVRELENVIRSAHALAPGRAIDLEHLHPRMRVERATRVPGGGFFDEVTRFRRNLVERSLENAEGNQSRAAVMLGISRQALAYQIRELGIVVRRRAAGSRSPGDSRTAPEVS
jgi:DNA-binding NtrC family response regulator/tetratricopeptide (TPR) repeat protein